MTRMMTALSVALALTACHAQPEPAALVLHFDGALVADSGAAPTVAEGVTFADGKEGQGAKIEGKAKLAYAAPAFLTQGFEIEFWVKHEQSLDDLLFQELVYVCHETENQRNRICLQKRMATKQLLFSMSDGKGSAKGHVFSGDWFAIISPPLDWAAGTWHRIKVRADRAAGQAALSIDGKEVASAKGTEMPDEVGSQVWIGSLAGRSQMRSVMDDLSIRPLGEVQQ